MKKLEYPFDGELILKKKKSIKKRLLATLEERSTISPKKIAILGGSTTGTIKQMLELFLLNYGIKPSFYESDYNQYYQDAMFPNAELEAFAPDIIYLHTSIHNITSFPTMEDNKKEVKRKLTTEYEKFKAIWTRLAVVYQCPIIQNNFEYPYHRIMGNRDSFDIHGKTHYITRLNLMFAEYAGAHENFYINDINYLSSYYGLEKWSDPFYWYMYKYALAVEAIPELAFNLAKIIKSIYGKNKKGLVLDLDNTLWGGIVGDDGVENLALGPETPMGQVYSAFQVYLKELKQLGIVLNVNSKNEYENAIAGLQHTDGALNPEDFIVIKANWEPKNENFLQIAEELNLLPESLVFIDDNPAERAIVKNSIPNAAVPDLDRVEEYAKTIDRSGFFEVTGFSKEDAKRNKMYRENAQRSKLSATFQHYEDYLYSLEMKATIKPFETIYMARIAQLTNKSNQFNLTTKRYTQAEIESISRDKNHITIYGKLEDKFGDNGVVSLVIGAIDGVTLHIDLWLMSCRVLKRDMEFAMLDALIAASLAKNIKEIRGYYYKTAKNNMVKDFYERMGFEKVEEDENENSEWKLQNLSAYKYKNKVIKVGKEK